MRYWSWFIVLGLIFWIGTTTVSAESVPVASYWATLEEIETNLAAPEQLTPLIAKLATWDEIALEDGRVIPIDHSFLVAQLDDETLPLESKEALLTNLLAMKKESAPIQEKLATDIETILAQAEFDYSIKPPSLWERFWAKVQELLSRPFQNSSLPPWIGNSFLYLGSLIVVIFILYITRGFWAQFAPQSAVPNDEHEEGTLSANDASLRAQTLSETGDYRSAVRYLYLSALLRLDEQGILRYDRAKTNREYLRLMGASPFAPILREVVDLFDRVWYGFEPLASAEYQHYARQVEKLKQTP